MQPLLHRAFGVYALDGFQMERIRHQSKALVKSKQESTISRVVVHNVGGKYGHEHAGSDRSQQDYRQSDPLPTGSFVAVGESVVRWRFKMWHSGAISSSLLRAFDGPKVSTGVTRSKDVGVLLRSRPVHAFVGSGAT
jgi:hypothetical protein